MRGVLLYAAALNVVTIAGFADEPVRERTEDMVRRSFSSATDEEWASRMRQDEAQSLCSLYRNSLPEGLSRRVASSQQKAIRYPPGDRLLGDWRRGERIASTSGGGHVGRIQPDPAGAPRGGNCYACHVLDPKEIAAGTIGPSLAGYGKTRGANSEAIKRTYDKIYNPQAAMPCSLMPRFGHNGWLTPQQVADTVAYLLDPDSPVNR